jgi:very-short-patch-repair endonuclease
MLPARGVTFERCILKYGNEEGQRRWEEYCQKQSLSNKFEYKQQKFNMSEDNFKLYNKKRAVTLENFCLRYGNEEGQRRWEEYISRQKYTKSKEYYIELFGEIEGVKKFNELSILKSNSKKSFLLKYGKEEGIFRYNQHIKNGFVTYSKSSQECFDTILLLLNSEEKNTTFYATFNNEENIENYLVDFLVKKIKLVVEYLGDYWHCNPKFVKEDFKIRNGKTAKEIREFDNTRKKRLEELGYYVIHIWENDWHYNKNEVLISLREVINVLRNKIS